MGQRTPNILLVMTDQMIPMMLGAYGNAIAKTPNIDRLGREGILFRNAYTSCPICAPARMSLLTGKYVSNINSNDNTSILPSDEPTHNHYLTIAGYDCVLSGKLHAVGPDQLHGFTRRLTTDIYPANFNWLASCRPEPGKFAAAHKRPTAVDYVAKSAGVRQWSMQLDYDEETHFRALEYLRNKRTEPSGSMQTDIPVRDDRPFFLQVSYTHPHEPFHPQGKHWDLYKDVEIPIPQYPENLEETYSSMDRDLAKKHGCNEVDVKNPDNLRAVHRAYLACVSYCDEKVGELLETLDQCGLTDDTIVIFTSDHGDMLGHRGMVQKRSFYEYSSRIPLIFRFPKGFPTGAAGTVCNDLVSIVDIVPTMLELVGITDYLPVDGRSLIPQLQGRTDPDLRVFCEHHSESVTGTCFMIRKGKYKYNYIYQRESQLFDLERDPEEWNNLSGKPEYRKIEDELQKLILEKFDPEKIDRELDENIRKRKVIKKALDTAGGPNWAYQPFFDATQQYSRKG